MHVCLYYCRFIPETKLRWQIKAIKQAMPPYQLVVYLTNSHFTPCYPTTRQKQGTGRLPGTSVFFSECSRRCCSDWSKMPLPPFALLFLAGVFLTSAEAQSSFSKLTDSYKKGVELALQNVNAHEGVQQHFLFFKSIQKSQIEVL